MFEKSLKSNLELKILSLLLAAFLWFAVHLTNSAALIGIRETGLRIPLVTENVAPGLIVLEVPKEIFIGVKETGRNVGEPSPSDFKAYVDLQGKPVGLFQDLPVRIASPTGYEVAVIKPDHVEVMLDSQARKTVPVRWESSREQEKMAENVVLTPSELFVLGPKSLIEQVAAAEVEIPSQANQSGLPQPLVPVPVDSLQRPVTGLQFSPSLIVATIRFSQKAQSPPVPRR